MHAQTNAHTNSVTKTDSDTVRLDGWRPGWRLSPGRCDAQSICTGCRQTGSRQTGSRNVQTDRVHVCRRGR